MALNVFTQALTAQKIVAAADQRAGSPGYYLNTGGTEDLTAPAYVELQAILDHLATWFDWTFQADAVEVTITDRATTLPLDFWRARFSEAYIIHPVTGGRTPLALIGHREWHQRVTAASTARGLPQIGTIMKRAGWSSGGSEVGTLYTDPAADRSYICELHYTPVAPALTTITTKPWFPDAEYLITKLEAVLLRRQDDSRADGVELRAEKLLREIQRAQSDPGQRSHQIEHDPLVFRPGLRSLAN